MLSLFASELNFYLTKDVQPELFVDTSRNEKMRINLDVTFPMMPCSLISTLPAALDRLIHSRCCSSVVQFESRILKCNRSDEECLLISIVLFLVVDVTTIIANNCALTNDVCASLYNGA